MTKEQLIAYIEANLPNNTANEITPAILRDVLEEMTDIMYPEPGEGLPVWNTTLNILEGEYYFYAGKIWLAEQNSGPAYGGAVEPGTNAAFWTEGLVSDLLHVQNTDFRLGLHPVLIELNGPTVSLVDGSFVDLFKNKNFFVFWPTTPENEQEYSIKTVEGNERATQEIYVLNHPSNTHSIKFTSDANQEVGPTPIVLEPGEFIKLKGAFGSPVTTAKTTLIANKIRDFLPIDIVDSTTKHDLSVYRPNVQVITDPGNTDLGLPLISVARDMEFNIAKSADSAGQVNIIPSGTDRIFFASADSGQLRTTVVNSWIRLKADGAKWWVMAIGGTWTNVT